MRGDAEPVCDCHSNKDVTVVGMTLAGLVFGVSVRISVRFRARQSQNRTLKLSSQPQFKHSRGFFADKDEIFL